MLAKSTELQLAEPLWLHAEVVDIDEASYPLPRVRVHFIESDRHEWIPFPSDKLKSDFEGLST